MINISATVTERYSNPNATDIIMNEGDNILVNYPNSLYLTLLTPENSTNIGNFAIQYYFINKNPNHVLGNMTDEELAKVVDDDYLSKWQFKLFLVKRTPFVGTNTFYIILFSGIFVLVLISVLVWALLRIKKQNELIVAKVEKL